MFHLYNRIFLFIILNIQGKSPVYQNAKYFQMTRLDSFKESFLLLYYSRRFFSTVNSTLDRDVLHDPKIIYNT